MIQTTNFITISPGVKTSESHGEELLYLDLGSDSYSRFSWWLPAIRFHSFLNLFSDSWGVPFNSLEEILAVDLNTARFWTYCCRFRAHCPQADGIGIGAVLAAVDRWPLAMEVLWSLREAELQAGLTKVATFSH